MVMMAMMTMTMGLQLDLELGGKIDTDHFVRTEVVIKPLNGMVHQWNWFRSTRNSTKYILYVYFMYY